MVAPSCASSARPFIVTEYIIEPLLVSYHLHWDQSSLRNAPKLIEPACSQTFPVRTKRPFASDLPGSEDGRDRRAMFHRQASGREFFWTRRCRYGKACICRTIRLQRSEP